MNPVDVEETDIETFYRYYEMIDVLGAEKQLTLYSASAFPNLKKETKDKMLHKAQRKAYGWAKKAVKPKEFMEGLIGKFGG